MTNRRSLSIEDKKQMIALLEVEVGAIEAGGYGRSPRTPYQDKSIFRDSVACINHWLDPNHPADSCEGCILLNYVPGQYQDVQVPCHYIPLNQAGDTVATLEETGDRARLEKAVADWLRQLIQALKAEVADQNLKDISP